MRRIVGSLSLEHVSLDVTGIPGVAVGDEVVFIGRQGRPRSRRRKYIPRQAKACPPASLAASVRETVRRCTGRQFATASAARRPLHSDYRITNKAACSLQRSQPSPARHREGAIVRNRWTAATGSAEQLHELLSVQPREPLSAEIARKLLDYLLSGVLLPGDRLPSERELSRTFGVGRSAVRDALKPLTLLGIIDVRQG